MLTTSRPAELENALPDQGFTPLAEILTGTGLLYNVKQSSVQGEVKPDQPCALQRRDGESDRGSPRRSKRARKKSGGWGTTSYIDHELWKLSRHRLIELARQGYAPTVFATVRRRQGCSEADAKKRIGLEIARLGQKLERKGHLFIALTVYEKPRGGLLHAHVLIYVQPNLFKVVANWADYFEATLRGSQRLQDEEPNVPIHARRAVESDGFYILKQHQFAGPREKEIRGRWWLPSEPIKGQRVSWTKVALALLGEVKPDRMKRAASADTIDRSSLFGPLPELEAPSRDHVLQARPRPKLIAYDQLELKLERLPDAIDLMGRIGATDAEIAARIGRSRPQTTNIRNRQFGASRPVVRRILELALAA